MITFCPRDVFRLGLAMAAVCVVGILLGYAMRRWFRPNALAFDWKTAVWMWIGFWAFGMLMSLVADLTISAGAPYWLQTFMFILMGVMAVGIAQSERRFAVRRKAIPSEPIHQVRAPQATNADRPNT